MTNDEQAIRALLDAYTAAVRAKDVDAFTALYADDVRVFDMWGAFEHDGIATWRRMAEQWFGSLGDEQVGVGFDEIQVQARGELGVAHTFVRYAGLSAEGEELRSMTNRMTWTLARGGDGAWRVVHEHSSAPADPETGKVILSR